MCICRYLVDWNYILRIHCLTQCIFGIYCLENTSDLLVICLIEVVCLTNTGLRKNRLYSDWPTEVECLACNYYLEKHNGQ